MEGDDEREEDSDEENSEAEEEEDEPRLKYQRMGGSVPTLLQSDAASCIAVAERMIALGTHGGSIHILDFLGNQVSLVLVFCCLDLWCLDWVDYILYVGSFWVHNHK